MIKYIKIFILVIGATVALNAQVMLAPGGKIHDFDGAHTVDSFPLQVQGLPDRIDEKFGLSKVCFNISHTRVSDLKVELLAPDGSSIWLSNRNGGDVGSGYMNTCFRSNGFHGYIHRANAPFEGEFIPDGRFDFINNGQNPNGKWFLLVSDLRKGEEGQLSIFSFEFGADPMININKGPCSFDNCAACKCAGGRKNKTCTLLPDLIILEAFTKNQIEEYAWNDPNYPGQIRFAATIANIGDGPMETIGKGEWVCGNEKWDSSHPCPDGHYARQRIYQRIYALHKGKITWSDRSAGTNYFDNKPGHDHFHVDNWVEFRLVKKALNERGELQTRLVANANKVSYCLFDSGVCNNQDGLCQWGGVTYGEKNLANYGLGNFSSCKSQKQGIGVGGYDTYGMMYEGQFIQLPDNLATGQYILEIEVDPLKIYNETDRSNNLFSMPVTINKQQHQ